MKKLKWGQTPLEDDCLDAQRKLIKIYLAKDRTGSQS